MNALRPRGPGDSATVSVHVAVSRDDAFDVFTREIDLWWRTGPRFRVAGRRRGALFFEPRLGGRLFETFADDATPGEPRSRTVEVGKVIAWEPPARIELEWRGVNYEPHQRTFVEVTFEAIGEATNVTVKHYGLSHLPDDHPARHGKIGTDFSRMTGLHWGEIMRGLREFIAER